MKNLGAGASRIFLLALATAPARALAVGDGPSDFSFLWWWVAIVFLAAGAVAGITYAGFKIAGKSNHKRWLLVGAMPGVVIALMGSWFIAIVFVLGSAWYLRRTQPDDGSR